MGKRILVTGGAGFIGSTLVEQLLKGGHEVIIVDNFDPFYPRKIKERNISGFITNPGVTFIEQGIEHYALLEEKLRLHEFDLVVHLAAKAGVRPSILDPLAYQEVNVKGTQNLLEIARKRKIGQFIFASSSSVYGINRNVPWAEKDHVLLPISPYASTKVSGELLGHVYSHLFNIRFIALRFFTVYGPRQRPDLAIHKFAKAVRDGNPITMFGDGETYRDYTYVDDIVRGIVLAIDYDKTMYEVINIGNSDTVSLKKMIEVIERVFEKKAVIRQEPEQPGDVPVTFADVSKAASLLGYAPTTKFEEGITQFREWLLKNE
jgi:UDP-glucuronate 4-epimerase